MRALRWIGRCLRYRWRGSLGTMLAIVGVRLLGDDEVSGFLAVTISAMIFIAGLELTIRQTVRDMVDEAGRQRESLVE